MAWTTENGLNKARYILAGGGNNSNALSFGGDDDIEYLRTTESWNGICWFSENGLNTATGGLAGGGDSSNAISFGGRSSYLATTESWNGICWTAENGLNTSRYFLAGGGDSSDALSFGGHLVKATTESWNGICWTAENGLNTGRSRLAGGGDTGNAISFGGNDGNILATTESWSKTPITGTVTLNGAGVQGAYVEIWNKTQNATYIRKDVTDADGNYSIFPNALKNDVVLISVHYEDGSGLSLIHI